MDELLRDFLIETTDQIEGAENQLIELEANPRNAELIASIFRLLHTIKGTSSFLGLNRLQEIAHAAENVISEVRDGVPPTEMTVGVVLAAIDQIKTILKEVEINGEEPAGDDSAIKALLLDNLPSAAAAKLTKAEPAAADNAVRDTAKPQKAGSGRTGGKSTARKDSSSARKQEVVQAPASTPPVAAQKSGPSMLDPSQASTDGAGAQSRSSESIRVTVETIERIMQLVSELVLTRNQLLELMRHQQDETLKAPMQRLSSLTTDLQDAVMRARMQPVGRLYANLPRLIRELSSSLGKKILLETEGADTELDRQLIEVMRDPLTHLIRNCADHGLETPEERSAAGKPDAGTIKVSASHEAGQISIYISDDGRGLDSDRLREKAVATGIMSEAEAAQASDEAIHQIIFEPGFSTASAVTSVSGRGVGMDVVRSNLVSIGGSVSLKSKRGAGTTFSLKIPLTLAIAPALIIVSGGERFALPQHAVVEAVSIGPHSKHQVEKLQNALILKLRDEVIPVVDFAALVNSQAAVENEQRLAVIVRVGTATFGVIVDAVSEVQEIVVKPLSTSLGHLSLFTGHTILGDGSVVLIIDPNGVARRVSIEKADEKKIAAAAGAKHERRKVRYIMMRAGDGAAKILPLSLVSRIEMVPASALEFVNGRSVVQHENKLMPVVAVEASSNSTASEYPLVVVNSGRRIYGLVVDEIIDIFEAALDIEVAADVPGIVGAAIVNGRAVEILDTAHFSMMANPGGAVRRPENERVIAAATSGYFGDVLLPVIAATGFMVDEIVSLEALTKSISSSDERPIVLIEQEWLDACGLDVGKVLEVCRSEASGVVLMVSSIGVLATAHHDPLVRVVLKTEQRDVIDTLFQLSGAAAS